MEIDTSQLALDMLTALDGVTTIEPPTVRFSNLDFPTAYRVAAEAARLRGARGEQSVGRKIGYTNRNIWDQFNVHEPIWGHMYEHTVTYAVDNSAVLSLAGMVAPRIEPEIAFKLSGPVPAGCRDPAVVLRSVEWVARTFELVDCHYPGWKFRGPDSVADFSHHAALIVGEPLLITEDQIPAMVEALRDCRIKLLKDGDVADTGLGSNALGHPALALGFLADIADSQAAPLRPNEIITTGTLTSALPVQAGETWRTETDGLALPPLTAVFA